MNQHEIDNSNPTVIMAVATSRKSTFWARADMPWGKLAKKLTNPLRREYTCAEYLAMDKDAQSAAKDCGGFVGALLRDGKRSSASVDARTMVTLDLDDADAPGTVWQRLTSAYPRTACALYTTHSHTTEHPRLRIVMPLSRNCTPEECEAVSRLVALAAGMEGVDPTTFDASRLFYWPSCPKDAAFWASYAIGAPLDVGAELAKYDDWHDRTQWPRCPGENGKKRPRADKAEDPSAKKGVIGAFCRAYGIEAAIDTFLPDKYVRTHQNGRWTYAGGHVAGGMLVYDDKWAYSHHATDPAGGRLCNSFDLVRLHLYGALDKACADDTPATSLPSYKAMTGRALELPDARAELARERLASAVTDFARIQEAANVDNEGENNDAWMVKLEQDKKGVKSTAPNVVLILENAGEFKNHIWLNEFTDKLMVTGGLPWNKDAKAFTDADLAQLRVYLEDRYGITGRDKIADAVTAVASEHGRHPVREYFNALAWDGTPRVDRAVIHYLGAVDDELTRVSTRLHFAGAVARIFEPGCKYDYCLTLIGPEGCGKSSFFRITGGEWYADGITSMDGKTAKEEVGGKLIIELSEMAAMNRAEIESVKAFITRCSDTYRRAYGRFVDDVPRQCVFGATTNDERPLKGDNGNRRLNCVTVDPSLREVPDPVDALTADRDQLWAEAVAIYRKGCPLFLSAELVPKARERQAEMNVNADDPMRGMLESYCETPVPVDWPTYSLAQRRAWLTDADPLSAVGTVVRDRVAPAEFVCERMGRDLASADFLRLARTAGRYLREMGWDGPASSRHCENLYGRLKAYFRPFTDHYEKL